MWWINKNGNIEGPFSSEQLEKRVKLNMFRSLDRVSEDKAKRFYVKDTVFWHPTRTIKDPPPPPPPSSSPLRKVGICSAAAPSSSSAAAAADDGGKPRKREGQSQAHENLL